jgi:hypothetical protein
LPSTAGAIASTSNPLLESIARASAISREVDGAIRDDNIDRIIREGNTFNFARQKLHANFARHQPSGMGGQQESLDAQARLTTQGGKHIGVPGHFLGVQATSHNSTTRKDEIRQEA